MEIIEYTDKSCDKAKLKKFSDYRKKCVNCDFDATLNGSCYHLHQEILKTSPYFNAILRSEMKESQQKSVQITADLVSNKAFEEIIEYLYTGKITLDKQKVLEVFKAANYLREERVICHCIQYYLAILDETNIDDIRYIADNDNLLELSKQIDHLMDFDEFAASPALLDTSPEILMSLLSKRELVVRDELTVLAAICDWVRADEIKRNRHIWDLFRKLSVNFLHSPLLESFNLLSNKLVSSLLQNRMTYVFRNLLQEYEDFESYSYATGRCYWGGVYYALKEGIYVVRKLGEGPTPVMKHDFPTQAKMAFCHGMVYIIGGVVHKISLNTTKVVADVYRFDPKRRKVKRVASMLFPRSEHGVCVLHGKIYVFGGRTLVDVEYTTQTCEVYDPLIDQWERLPDIHHAVLCHATCFDEKIIVYARKRMFNYDFHPFEGALYQYNTVKRSWKRLDEGNIESNISSIIGFADFILCFTSKCEYFWYDPLRDRKGPLNCFGNLEERHRVQFATMRQNVVIMTVKEEDGTTGLEYMMLDDFDRNDLSEPDFIVFSLPNFRAGDEIVYPVAV